MLRARASNGNFIIGLDADNIALLKEGKPLKIDFRVMGGNDLVFIMYGDTLADVAHELEKEFGPLPSPQPWTDSH